MTALVWAGFILLILVLLSLDLGVFNRRPHELSMVEALGWSAFWVLLALVFNVLVFWLYEENWMGVGLQFPEDIDGRTAALEFFTGYLLEKSLSLDNIFVIALIFAHFRVPLAYQHRVLFWGVVGALVFRGVMIAAGAALLGRFSWMTYVFGALLLVTAARLLVVRDDNLEPDKSLVMRLARRWLRTTPELQGPSFFVRRSGVLFATPLFTVLLLIESTDLMFAVDSIPAIFAVTNDPFIVYTSNIFAILGLRSLYFALAPMLAKFRYLKASLVFVLAYVGVKMLLSHTYPIPAVASLFIVVGILGAGIVASVIGKDRDTAPLTPPVTVGQLPEPGPSAVWRAVVLVIGGATVLFGTAMIFLEGPATVVIPLGLALLATLVAWARRLIKRLPE